VKHGKEIYYTVREKCAISEIEMYRLNKVRDKTKQLMNVLN